VDLIESRSGSQLAIDLEALRVQLLLLDRLDGLATGTLDTHLEVPLDPVALDDESHRAVNPHRPAGEVEQLHLACIGQLGRHINPRRFRGIGI